MRRLRDRLNVLDAVAAAPGKKGEVKEEKDEALEKLKADATAQDAREKDAFAADMAALGAKQAEEKVQLDASTRKRIAELKAESERLRSLYCKKA